MSNGEVAAVIKVQRANAAEMIAGADPVPGAAAAGGPAAAAKDRMLDISIKIARVLLKWPDARKALLLMEQHHGKECVTDSPAKLEKIIQLCGGAESPSLGPAIVEVLKGGPCDAPTW